MNNARFKVGQKVRCVRYCRHHRGEVATVIKVCPRVDNIKVMFHGLKAPQTWTAEAFEPLDDITPAHPQPQ